MANSDRTRKLLVRTGLVTSTTIATLFGAQTLAMLDGSQFQDAQTAVSDHTIAAMPDSVSVPVARSAPEITILHTAPSITVLRQPGTIEPPLNNQTTTTSTATSTTIQPPAPSVSEPVVVQQPSRQRSRASR